MRKQHSTNGQIYFFGDRKCPVRDRPSKEMQIQLSL